MLQEQREGEGERGGNPATEKKVNLASTKPSGGVIATHKSNTGRFDSTPKEQQLSNSSNLHVFFCLKHSIKRSRKPHGKLSF